MKFSSSVFALAAIAITLSSSSVAVPMGMSRVMDRSSSIALAPRQNAAGVASEFGALLEGLPFGFALVPLVDALGLNPKGNKTQSGSLLFSNLTQTQLEHIEDIMAQVTKNLSTVAMPPIPPKMTRTHTPRQFAGIMSTVGALLDGLPVVGPMLEPLVSAFGMGPSTAGSLFFESSMDQKQLQKIQEAVAQVKSTLAEYDVLIGPMNTTSTLPVGNSLAAPISLPTSTPVNASIPPPPSASLPVTSPVALAPAEASLSLPPTKRMTVIHQHRQLASLMSTFASMLEGLPVFGSALEPLLKALGLNPTSAASSQADYMLDSSQVSQVQNAIAEASNSIAAIMATYVASSPAATSTLSPMSSGTPASSLATAAASSTIASSASITPSSTSAPTPSPIPATPPSSAPVPVDIDAMSFPERRQLAALMQLVDSELSSAGSLMTSLPIFGPALAPIVNAFGLGPVPPAQRTFFDNLTVKQLEDIHEAIAQVSQAVYSSATPTPSGFPSATGSAPATAPTSVVTSMSASMSGSASTSISALSSGSGLVSATGSTVTPAPSSTPTSP